jgi:hypothetical protein
MRFQLSRRRLGALVLVMALLGVTAALCEGPVKEPGILFSVSPDNVPAAGNSSPLDGQHVNAGQVIFIWLDWDGPGDVSWSLNGRPYSGQRGSAVEPGPRYDFDGTGGGGWAYGRPWPDGVHVVRAEFGATSLEATFYVGSAEPPAATAEPTQAPTATATVAPSPTSTATATASPEPTATSTAVPLPTAFPTPTSVEQGVQFLLLQNDTIISQQAAILIIMQTLGENGCGNVSLQLGGFTYRSCGELIEYLYRRQVPGFCEVMQNGWAERQLQFLAPFERDQVQSQANADYGCEIS